MPAYADFAKFYDQIMGDRSAMIHEALTPRFELLEAANTEGRPANDESDRAYFVYRHGRSV